MTGVLVKLANSLEDGKKVSIEGIVVASTQLALVVLTLL